MLKNRIVVMALLLTLLAAFAPAPSQAAPWGWTAASGPAAAGLFVKIERWWNRLLNGQERPAPEQRKNGCGIDPNGQPLCGTGTGPGGGGTGAATASSNPADLG